MAQNFFLFDINTKNLENTIDQLLDAPTARGGRRTREATLTSGGQSQLLGAVFEKTIEDDLFRQGKARKNIDASGEADFLLNLETISSSNLRNFIRQLREQNILTAPLLPEIKEEVFQTGEVKAKFLTVGKDRSLIGSSKIKAGTITVGGARQSTTENDRLTEVIQTVGTVKGLTDKNEIIALIKNNFKEINTPAFRQQFIDSLNVENTFLKKIQLLFLPVTFKTGTNRLKTLGLAVNTIPFIKKKDLFLELEERDKRAGVTFKIGVKSAAIEKMLNNLRKDLLSTINGSGAVAFSSELNDRIRKDPMFISNLINDKGKNTIAIGLATRENVVRIINNKFGDL